MKQYKTSLFIFRRDLRISDNTGLIAAIKQSHTIIPCFVFDTRQVGDKNRYRSANAIQFMIESLINLNEQLKSHDGSLYIFHGIAHEIIESLIKEKKIDAVFTNRDYTPFSIKRDEAIKKVCVQHDVQFHQYGDLLLHEPEEIKSKNGTPYLIFTPFFKASIHQPIRQPEKFPKANFYQGSLKKTVSLKKIANELIPESNNDLYVHGGRKAVMKIFKSLSHFKKYQQEKDFPAIATTGLSAHLKFGTASVREVYQAIEKELGHHHPLLRQLYWRDFFTHVAYHSPFVFGHAFHEKYDKISWSTNKNDFKAWCEGKTGFPIVDAGMRQLNATGFMHNRVRIIVASFLTKDLHIDWRWGELYFARQLVDYDPAVNNGNWQWSASTGCDAQPYFRIFNPWLQQIKFDPQCVYIKQWIPELKQLDPKIIHKWNKFSTTASIDYPKPLVDHSNESTKSKTIYKKATHS